MLDAGLGASNAPTTRRAAVKSRARTKNSATRLSTFSKKRSRKNKGHNSAIFTEKSFGRDGLKFGGSLLKKSNAKTERVLDSKKPIHLVVRSTQATGRKSFLYFGQKVESVIQRHAKSKGIRIYEMANGGNHIHIIMRIPKQRRLYSAFIRGFTGELARLMTGAKKGKKGGTGGPTEIATLRFWDHKPFTRILSGWGKDFLKLKNYLRVNNCETILGMSRFSSKKMLAEIKAFHKNGLLVATGFG